MHVLIYTITLLLLSVSAEAAKGRIRAEVAAHRGTCTKNALRDRDASLSTEWHSVSKISPRPVPEEYDAVCHSCLTQAEGKIRCWELTSHPGQCRCNYEFPQKNLLKKWQKHSRKLFNHHCHDYMYLEQLIFHDENSVKCKGVNLKEYFHLWT